MKEALQGPTNKLLIAIAVKSLACPESTGTGRDISFEFAASLVHPSNLEVTDLPEPAASISRAMSSEHVRGVNELREVFGSRFKLAIAKPPCDHALRMQAHSTGEQPSSVRRGYAAANR